LSLHNRHAADSSPGTGPRRGTNRLPPDTPRKNA
jgi:hypothetical protein